MMKEMLSKVADAAHAFERRWTMRALRRLDPELYERWHRQRMLWEEALVTGTDADLQEQGEAMCRGWFAVARRMEEAGVEDCSYLLGRDERTGLRVAVGEQPAAQDRVCEVEGQAVIWVSPDEVATLLAAQRDLLSIKSAFPGCEVTDLYRNERPLEAVQ